MCVYVYCRKMSVTFGQRDARSLRPLYFPNMSRAISWINQQTGKRRAPSIRRIAVRRHCGRLHTVKRYQTSDLAVKTLPDNRPGQQLHTHFITADVQHYGSSGENAKTANAPPHLNLRPQTRKPDRVSTSQIAATATAAKTNAQRTHSPTRHIEHRTTSIRTTNNHTTLTLTPSTRVAYRHTHMANRPLCEQPARH